MSFVIIVIRKLSWHAADNDEIICMQIEYNGVIIAQIYIYSWNYLFIIFIFYFKSVAGYKYLIQSNRY